MAFVCAAPLEQAPDAPAELLFVSIRFTGRGGARGELDLLAPRGFGRLLAANLTAAAPDDPEVDARAIDVLKELLNVTCGDFVTRYAATGDAETGHAATRYAATGDAETGHAETRHAARRSGPGDPVALDVGIPTLAPAGPNAWQSFAEAGGAAFFDADGFDFAIRVRAAAEPISDAGPRSACDSRPH